MYFAYAFLKSTHLNYVAPDDSLVFRTEKLAQELFTSQVQHNPLFVLLEAAPASSDQRAVVSFTSTPPLTNLLCNFTSYLQQQQQQQLAGHIISIMGYCTAKGVPDFQRRTIGGAHNDSTVLVVDFSSMDKQNNRMLDTISAAAREWLRNATAASSDFCLQMMAASAGGSHTSNDNGTTTTTTGPSFECPTVTSSFTSIPQMAHDLEDGLVSDMLRIDCVTLPLAVLAMIVCLKSIRCTLLPLVTLPVTLIIGFACSYAVSFAVEMSSFAPELSAATMIALSLDFVLFIVSRFKELSARYEARFKSEGVAAFDDEDHMRWCVVRDTTRLSAHNIVVSGFTIAVSMGSIVFLKGVGFLSSIGYAFFFGVVGCVFVSLTLLPSMLLLFYGFFRHEPELDLVLRAGSCLANFACGKGKNKALTGESERLMPAPIDEIGHGECSHTEKPPSMPRSDTAGDRNKSNGDIDGPACGDQSGDGTHDVQAEHRPPLSVTRGTGTLNLAIPIVTGPASPSTEANAAIALNEARRHSQNSSPWFIMGRWATQHPYVIAVILCLLGTPLAYYATTIRVDFNLFHQIPTSSPHGETLLRITDKIGQGYATPFYLVVDTGRDQGLHNDTVFAKINDLIDFVHNQTGQPLDRILSPVRVPGLGAISWTEAYLFLQIASVSDNVQAKEYAFLFNRSVNVARDSAMVIALATVTNPFGSHIVPFINALHDSVVAFDTQGLFTVGFFGASSDSWSLMTSVWDEFPILIGVTFSIIFVFIGVVFRSVVVPFRMLFTVAFTVFCSFGFGVLMFQYSWIHPLWPAMQSVRAYSWTVPIFLFSLLSALALDYDVFLLTRVVEIRNKGFRPDVAVSKGVAKTGRIISFAGIIMALSLGSLALSDVVMLNQFGAVSAFSVLLDCFVVRPFFVPALLSLAPRWTFWPRTFESRDRGESDMDD